MRAVIPVRSSRRQLPVALSVLLTAGLGTLGSPASAADSDKPPPPPGPYTSTTLVDVPVEEAQALGFPPLDYSQSLEESSAPPSGPLRWEEEYPDKTPAEAGPNSQASSPALDSFPSPSVVPEASVKPAAEPPVAPAAAGGSDLGRTAAERSTQPAPGSLEQAPRVREPKMAPGVTQESAGGYPPLEGEHETEAAGISPAPQSPTTAEGVRLAPTEPAPATAQGDGHRVGGALGQSESHRANAPRQAPQSAPPIGQPSPVYGYQGYQMPRPYYPGQPPRWTLPPGYRVPQTQQGQGATRQVQPGSAGAPSYPGMYYPPSGYRPGGYGQFLPPPPSQGSASGGPQ